VLDDIIRGVMSRVEKSMRDYENSNVLVVQVEEKVNEKLVRAAESWVGRLKKGSEKKNGLRLAREDCVELYEMLKNCL